MRNARVCAGGLADHTYAVPLKYNVTTIMKSGRGLRDLGGVEIFMLVCGHGGVKVGNEGGDGQVVIAVIGGPE